jgi:hypothetical protein
MTNDLQSLRAAQDYLAAETLRYWQARPITVSSPVAVPWSRRVGRVFAFESPRRRAKPEGLPPLAIVEVPTRGVVTRLREQVYHYPGITEWQIALRGGPGTGKTTAMQFLLIDVLRRRAPDEPVPVWLPCSEWNPNTTPLLTWVASTMLRDYPGLTSFAAGPRGCAAELIHHDRVALFLDGLDELPLAARAKALGLIKQEASFLRVVLSRRPPERHAAFQAGMEKAGSYRSAVIEIQPVGVSEAEAFLLAGQSGERREAWQRVIDHLREQPLSAAARAFTSPLALSLAREIYAGPDTDPADLLNAQAHPTAEALQQHLLSHRLPVLHPYPDTRADDARRPSRVSRLLGPIRVLWTTATGLWDTLASEYDVLAARWATRGELRKQLNLMFSYCFLLAVVGIGFGIALGIVLGIAIAIASGPLHGLVGGIAIGMGIGLAAALAAGILFCLGALWDIFFS